jgi:RNA-directed DNA polymerase
MSTEINRLSELAKEDPKRQFFSIAHLITPEKMYAAFLNLRKDASAGVDGVTYKEYEKTLRETSANCISGSKMASIGPNRCAESISPRKTGNRGRSRFPPSRTNSCRG